MTSPMSLEIYASVTAWLADHRPLAAALDAHGIANEDWARQSMEWEEKVIRDPEIAAAFSDAFVRAQDARNPLPTMTPEEWAELSVAVGRDGIERALATRGISSTGYAQLARHFARLLATDRAARDRHATAFCRATAPANPRV